jgi:hypothetical protein
LDGQGSTDAATVAQPILNSSNIHLEHGSEAASLNTGTMTDRADLTETLLANFRTVRIPAPHLIRPKPVDVWAAAAKWRAEKQYADEYRDLLGRFLIGRGHCFLTYLEEDPYGGFRLHFFAGRAALAYLGEMAGTDCGPGDPVNLDAVQLILQGYRWTDE